MSEKSFNYFTSLAKNRDNYLEIAGRTNQMQDAEKLIIPDIIQKLDINSKDKMLDIGCGPGNLLIMLLPHAKEIMGIDNESSIELLKKRCGAEKRILYKTGNFLDTPIDLKFDKILCYSVIHYLSNITEVFTFIYKALELLNPGGRALFGDIPNISKKERFLKSNYGKNIDQEYHSLLKMTNKNKEPVSFFENDEELVQFNDDLLIRILKETRENGYHSYVLDQSTNLCLGYTREDILIVNPED